MSTELTQQQDVSDSGTILMQQNTHLHQNIATISPGEAAGSTANDNKPQEPERAKSGAAEIVEDKKDVLATNDKSTIDATSPAAASPLGTPPPIDINHPGAAQELVDNPNGSQSISLPPQKHNVWTGK